MDGNQFENVIRKYFGDDYDEYEEDRDQRTVSFRVQSGEIEFDKLDAISRVLDTKLINFGEREESSGGCETCGYSNEYYVLVKCSGVRFDLQDPPNEVREIIKDL